MLHRAGLAYHLAPGRANLLAGAVHIQHFNGDVAVSAAQIIAAGIPIPGQLQHRVFGLVAITDKGIGKAAVRVVLAAQQGHAEHFGVEGDGFFEVSNTEHGVQNSHDRRPCEDVQTKLPVSPLRPQL